MCRPFCRACQPGQFCTFNHRKTLSCCASNHGSALQCTSVHAPKSFPVHTRVFCSLLQMGTLNFWLPAKGAQRASCPWSTLTPMCGTRPCLMLRVPMMSSFLTWRCRSLSWHSSRSASVPFVSVPACSISPWSHPGDRAVGGGRRGWSSDVFCALCLSFDFEFTQGAM